MCSRHQQRMCPLSVLFVVITVISSSIFILLHFNIHSGVKKYVAYSIDTNLKDTMRTSDDGFTNSCADTSSKELEAFFGKVNTDRGTWTFRKRVKCNNIIIGNQFATKARRKLSVVCSKGSAHVAYSSTSTSSDVLTFEYGDPCLSIYVNTCCGKDHVIPNVVHYVWYMNGQLEFVPFLSILSVIRFVKPCAIIFHGELPTGKYWDAIVYFYPNILHLNRKRPEHIFGIKIIEKTHSSDIMRLEALSEYGGIYLDTDTILVRPLTNLMDYPFILSTQNNNSLGSAFIMSERNASFLQLWLNEYKTDYRPNQYIYNAMMSTRKLAKQDRNKDLIHVENGTISRPKPLLETKIYQNEYATYDWSYIYGMHMFIRSREIRDSERTIRFMNTTFGSICRHVYYGNKELCLYMKSLRRE